MLYSDVVIIKREHIYFKPQQLGFFPSKKDVLFFYLY